jgi:tetratricopeptide (TPR) repeat protein
VAEARRAQSLDPASGAIRANVATVLQFCGRHGEAIEEAGRAIAADPGSLRAHFILGLALEQAERLPEALAAFETAVALSHGSNPAALGAWGYASARAGNLRAAERALRTLEGLAPEVTSLAKALVKTALGSHGEALRWLRRACDSREFYLVMLGVDRRLDPLRRREGFRALLERVGLTA